MSIVRCDECGFLYEVINYQPCPTCRMLKQFKEEDMTKKILVSYDTNWADEFDVQGFKIYTEKEWEEVKTQAKKCFEKVDAKNKEEKKRIKALKESDPKGYHYFRESEEEFYFGTNEAMVYTGYKDWIKDYTVVEVTKEEIAVLEKLGFVGDYGYGIFIEPEYYDDED